ncbi:MAG: SAM-dependent methyltransferase, partial [Acidimicrobiia bacterium]
MRARAAIVEAIAEAGPIPFEHFMELSLYHPEGGFFTAGKLRSEKAGDFLTSPEVSSLFGETLAGFLMMERERIGEPFELVEVAAGSGSLLSAILEAISLPVTAVEASDAARDALRRVLPGDRVTDMLPDSVRGVILANELIDNLPMALAQRVDAGWRERWVGMERDQLVFVDAAPRPRVSSWLEAYAGDVDDGGWVEVQLVAADWVTDTLQRLGQGALVLIDYGETAENLLPRRRDGTLRTYRAHHLGPHPLDEPGATDITADVNFTALVAVAESAGAEVELYRQDEFLGGLGLRERLSELRSAELEAARSGDDMERLRLRTLKTEAETLLH